MQQNIAIFKNIAKFVMIRTITNMTKLHFLVIKLFSFRHACPIICVIMPNHNNEFIIGKKTWPISKSREFEIELEFERIAFNDL